ncbi:hypothetical protein Fmac_009878 [Flemingia macrophylla]|uniref:Uncharacterized protein n=1 Tax=Flemingia macrophylla TaxID=520843 RepID=A0ABD1N1G1_9FABA
MASSFGLTYGRNSSISLHFNLHASFSKALTSSTAKLFICCPQKPIQLLLITHCNNSNGTNLPLSLSPLPANSSTTLINPTFLSLPKPSNLRTPSRASKIKMGCCVSTDNHPFQSPRSFPAEASESRAPPEEETVKEVLSETPKWKPKFEAVKPTDGEVASEKEKPFSKPQEISEVSEVCSVSESLSTLADEEARQRVNVDRSPAKALKARSFSGEFGFRRELTAGKSPARQSPGRRNVGSARVAQMSNGGTGSHTRRRDAGDNSGRRSRSPATRTDTVATRSVVGRSPSAKRTQQSPARVRTAEPENVCRKIENSSMESLENPLVSLECFIFL